MQMAAGQKSLLATVMLASHYASAGASARDLRRALELLLSAQRLKPLDDQARIRKERKKNDVK
jgi:hypothetical protein